MFLCCSFSLQDIATVVSAYSRAGPVDRILLESMSAAVRLLPGDMIDPQTLALTANAFARARAKDPPLFAHLATAALSLDVALFDPQAIAYLLNALARDWALTRSRPKPPAFIQAASRNQQVVGERFGARLSGFDAANSQSEVGRIKILEVLQSEAVIDPSTSEAGLLGVRAVDFDAAVGKGMGLQGTSDNDLRKSRAASFPVSNAGNGERTQIRKVDGSGMSDDELKALADYLISGSSRLSPATGRSLEQQSSSESEMEVFQHLGRAIVETPAAAFSSLTTALIANAYVKSRADLHPSAKMVFSCLAQSILAISPKEFDAQNAANIVNAFGRSSAAKTNVTAAVLQHMAEAVLLLNPKEISAQAVATLINGFATSLTLHPPLLNHLLSAMCVSGMRAGAAEVATSFHGLAVLGWQSESWIELLGQAAAAVDIQSWQAEEAAMLAWAVAVLQVSQAELWLLLPKILDRQIASLDRSGLSQLHQLFLSIQLDEQVQSAAGESMKMLQFLEGQKCRAAFESFSRASAHPSALQRQVAGELLAAGWAVDEEVVEPLAGYSVDIVVRCSDAAKCCVNLQGQLLAVEEGAQLDWRQHAQEIVIVEVDGPFHFAVGSQRPLGSTLMKRRHLVQLGYNLAVVPYWCWDALRTAGPAAQRAYVEDLVLAALRRQ